MFNSVSPSHRLSLSEDSILNTEGDFDEVMNDLGAWGQALEAPGMAFRAKTQLDEEGNNTSFKVGKCILIFLASFVIGIGICSLLLFDITNIASHEFGYRLPFPFNYFLI